MNDYFFQTISKLNKLYNLQPGPGFRLKVKFSLSWNENVTSHQCLYRRRQFNTKNDRTVWKSSSVNEVHTQFPCKINSPGGNWTTCKDLRITLSIKQIVCYSIAIICDDSSHSEMDHKWEFSGFLPFVAGFVEQIKTFFWYNLYSFDTTHPLVGIKNNLTYC